MPLARTEDEPEYTLDRGEYAISMRDGAVPIRVVVSMLALKERGEMDSAGSTLTSDALIRRYRPLVEAHASLKYDNDGAYAETDGLKTVRVTNGELCREPGK